MSEAKEELEEVIRIKPLTYEELQQAYQQTKAKSGRRRKALKALMQAHERLLRQYEIALDRNVRLTDELIAEVSRNR